MRNCSQKLHENSDRKAWSLIKDLVAHGDALGRRLGITHLKAHRVPGGGLGERLRADQRFPGIRELSFDRREDKKIFDG